MSKEQSKETTSPVIEVKGKQGRRPEALYFPRDSLEDALKIPRIIWENNAGNPFSLLDMSNKLNCSVTSSGFAELLRSSQRYGLTEGSWNFDSSKTISLTALGSSIVAPTSSDDVNVSKRKALESPKIFKKIFDSLNGKIIPPEDVLKNTLIRDGHLSKSDAEYCYKSIIKNVSELGLAQEDGKGKKYLQINKLGTIQQTVTPEQSMEQLGEILEEGQSSQISTSQKPEEKQIPQVFISHSKNENILQQLKTILDFGTFQYKIAVEEETAAIPVPDKVFGLMRQCNCAIINISADEEMKQSDGKYRINENVLIEIGAAFVHYNRRVILLTDKRIELPSNLQGLYKCEYEGDELSFMVAMKLQKALTDFRKTI